LQEKDILAGLRVLVVEDETLIGILLEDMITELGAAFVGPCASLGSALAAAREDDFDVALVDMNLGGERADEVGRVLSQRGIPFALSSGDAGATGDLGQTTVLQKPFSFDDVSSVLRGLSQAAGLS